MSNASGLAACRSLIENTQAQRQKKAAVGTVVSRSFRCCFVCAAIPPLLDQQTPVLRDERPEHQRHDRHELQKNVEGRAGRILERVADGVTDNGRLVRIRARAPNRARYSIFVTSNSSFVQRMQ